MPSHYHFNILAPSCMTKLDLLRPHMGKVTIPGEIGHAFKHSKPYFATWLWLCLAMLGTGRTWPCTTSMTSQMAKCSQDTGFLSQCDMDMAHPEISRGVQHWMIRIQIWVSYRFIWFHSFQVSFNHCSRCVSELGGKMWQLKQVHDFGRSWVATIADSQICHGSHLSAMQWNPIQHNIGKTKTMYSDTHTHTRTLYDIVIL